MLALSPYAWTMWLHGLTYSSRNLTDGHIPAAILPRLSALKSPERAVEELVAAECWKVVEDGWAVVDYADHQRTKAQVEADRAAAAERKRRSRERKGQVTQVSQRDTPVSHKTVTPLETDTETDTDSSSSVVMEPGAPPGFDEEESRKPPPPDLEKLIRRVAAQLGRWDHEMANDRKVRITDHDAYRRRCVETREFDPDVIDACARHQSKLSYFDIASLIWEANQSRPKPPPDGPGGGGQPQPSSPAQHLPGTGHLNHSEDFHERWEETPSGLKRRKAAS